MIYGTAWKEERTEALVLQAIRAGFRAIDTANQRKHYYEEGVGKALSTAFAQGLVKREDLFLQTKFTFIAGQDHRLPYDPKAPYGEQVQQSFLSSLQHLGVEYLDSYVLHGPSSGSGLTHADLQVWEAMEALQKSGKVRALGVSNVSLSQLKELVSTAAIPPTYVQNRCFARTGWDKDIREFCTSHDIVYQGFSLLTANEWIVPRIATISERLGKTPADIIFCFALAVGMLPLTGTTSVDHMKQDLLCRKEMLTNEDVSYIENLVV